MKPEEIGKQLQERFGEVILSVELESGHAHAVVEASSWPAVARYLRDDPQLGFNLLRSITSLDMLAENKLAAMYDLADVTPGEGTAWITRHEFAVRVEVDRDAPHIPTVADVWPAADWHEREAFDLMGIHFDGHPDLRRILCPDDWAGHPLRKDYEFPMEYHGIPATTEMGLPSPRH